jgi:hypothetical protein
VLVEGTFLSLEQLKDFQCGQTSGISTSELLVTGLVNDQRYAVAVAAIDSAENVGELSEVVCERPQKTNGFDDAYRSAGGTAGGTSFCSLSLRSAALGGGVWPGASCPGALALLLVLRRRNRRSN